MQPSPKFNCYSLVQPEEIAVSVPAEEIIGLDAFERARAQAYSTGDHSSLTELATNTILKSGRCLYDRFERVLDGGDSSEESEKTSQMIARLAIGSVFYELVLDVDAEVRQIFRRVILAENKAVTAACRAMASRVPSGRRQNRTSFVRHAYPARSRTKRAA